MLDKIRDLWARLLGKRTWRVELMDGGHIIITLGGGWTQEDLAQFKVAWKDAWKEEEADHAHRV